MIAAIVTMVGAVALASYVVSVLIPRARLCIALDHGKCWRDPKPLISARRWLRALRWGVGLHLLVVLGIFLIDLGDWSPEHIVRGVYLAAQGYLWTRLVFPPELARRLAELECVIAAPWEVLP